MSAGQGPLLLTGASGWFGRTALWEYEQEHGPEALRRDVIPFASCERWVDFDSPHGPVKALPLEAIHAVQNPSGLLHLAFLTRDKVEELGWQCYVDSNREITAHIARVLKACPMLPVVTTSSGAAAALDGQPPDLEGNPYATLKKEEEFLLKRESPNRMAIIFRVYAASGRFMTRPEKFALGDFLTQAMCGAHIRIHSQGKTVRGYVHVGQLMRVCWDCLLTDPVPRYTLINACTHIIELGELARLVADMFRLPTPVRNSCSPTNSDYYFAETDEFLRLLQDLGRPVISIQEQIFDTLQCLRSAKNPTALVDCSLPQFIPSLGQIY